MRRGNIIKHHETKNDIELDWKIEEFLPFLQSPWTMKSPSFIWHSVRWELKMIYNSDDEIQLFLHKSACDKQPSVMVKFGIRLTDGSTETRCFFPRHFRSSSAEFGTVEFILKSELTERQSELIVEGTLTLTCSIANIKTLKISRSGKYEDLEVLSSNLKALYNSQQNSDMTIVIGEQKFPVHKAILAARSDVFSAMLQHNMKEVNTSIIEIADCDPASFKDFISYLYTGKVENLSCNNLCQLYRAADKYHVQDLKILCLKYIEISASTTCFLNIVIQAHQAKDPQLVPFLQEKFNENALGIMKDPAWEQFLKENSPIANQLMINMLEKNKTV